MAEKDLALQQEMRTKAIGRFVALNKSVKDFKITDDESKKKAIEYVREYEALQGQFDEYLDYFTKDLKDHIKKIEKDVKPYMKEVKAIIGDYKDPDSLRGKISLWETEQDRIRKQQEEDLRLTQQKQYEQDVKNAEKKGQLPPPPPAPISVQAKKEEGVSMSDKWIFEVINEDLVPDEYKIKALDEKKINKVISAGVRTINGLRIYSIKVPTIREEKVENL